MAASRRLPLNAAQQRAAPWKQSSDAPASSVERNCNDCNAGAAPRVEDRVVLEHDHRGLHRGQRVPAGREHRVPGRDRPLDAVLRASYKT